MDALAAWMQDHVASSSTAAYLRNLAGLIVGIAAAWYVIRQALAKGNAGAALNVSA